MKRRRVLIAVVVLSAFAVSKSRAASIVVAIDGASVSVPVFELPPTDPDAGKLMIGTPAQPGFDYSTSEGAIHLEGLLDPDPSIQFGGSATDIGAASNFSFMFILPLAPQISNPSLVFDSFSGGVTNGPAAGGVTVTALAPPAGIPVDADGIDELQVFTLSDDGGSTWKNVGLDAGPTATIPLGSNASGQYGTFNQGYIATIAGGPWTHMRADMNFSLSGGGDQLNFVGAKVLVPEPGTLLLTLLSLSGAMVVFRRRSR